MLDDVAYVPQTNAGLFAVSRAGTFIYRTARSAVPAMTTMQWISASDGDARRSPTGDARRLSRASIVAGRQADRARHLGGAKQDIWVLDPQRDALTRLTFDGVNVSPVWTPSGQSIVFEKIGQGIFQARADDASQPRALMPSGVIQLPWSFTPDGKTLAYWERDQIWTVALEDQGGQSKAGTPEPFLKSTFNDQAPSISPDGSWLAYHSTESGKNEVYVRTFPPSATSPGGNWQVSNNGGAFPRWSRIGHELVYQSADQLMAVSYTVKAPRSSPTNPGCGSPHSAARRPVGILPPTASALWR